MSTQLVASLTRAADLPALAGLPSEVEVLEVRGDLMGDPDAAALRDRFSGRLLYTLRSRAEGGRHDGSGEDRRQRLGAAAADYDLVDLEAARDLSPQLLEQIPEEKRLISWHGRAPRPEDIRRRFDSLSATPARYYKLISNAASSGEAPVPLLLLKTLQRQDVIAFAGGEVGAWTRPLAAYLGSPLLYGSFGSEAAAPGQIEVERLVRDYGLPRLHRGLEGLFGIVGDPVLHSLSPRLHNGAYRALGLPYLYLPFETPSFGDFWIDLIESGHLETLEVPVLGLSVTSPYKAAALAVAGAVSPRAEHIEAVNTLYRPQGVWEAETTDVEGTVEALREIRVPLAGRRAAVVGCGGAGKAAAFGMQLAQAEVTLVNRGRERGESAAEELQLPFLPLADFDPAGFDVVVHATALGHHPEDPLPFAVEDLRPQAVLVDLVYDAQPTPLYQAARRLGRTVIDGRTTLLHQAVGQFRLMTGRSLDVELARKLLDLEEEPR